MEEPFEGLQRFTFDQVYRADVVFFNLLNDATRGGLRRHGSNERPLDRIFEATMLHPRFTQAMTPRLALAQRGAAAIANAFGNPSVVGLWNPSPADSTAGKGKKRNNPRAQGGRPAVQPKPKPLQQHAANPQGSKGGGGKAAIARGPRLPPGLFGMCPRSSQATESKRLCFSFNLGNCKLVSPGQECSRGWHICMKPAANGQACGQSHPASTCTAC
jgi:hypothetical protein